MWNFDRCRLVLCSCRGLDSFSAKDFAMMSSALCAARGWRTPCHQFDQQTRAGREEILTMKAKERISAVNAVNPQSCSFCQPSKPRLSTLPTVGVVASAYLSIYLFVYLPVCITRVIFRSQSFCSIFPSPSSITIFLSLSNSTYLSIDLSVCLFVFLSVRLAFCLSILSNLSAHPALYLSTYLPIYVAFDLSSFRYV